MATRQLRHAPPHPDIGATTVAHPTAESRLLHALATADVGAWDWDIVAGRVSWNPAHERICGYAPGTFGGDVAEFFALVLPEDRPPLEHAIAGARTARREYVCSYRLLRRDDGALRWVRGRGIFFYDPRTGEATHAAGTIVDVTDERRAEAARARSEERLALALDGAEQALWEWNAREDTFLTSACAATMLGYAPGELGSRTGDWRALTHPEDLPRVDAALAAHARGAAPVIESEHRMRARDGTWRWVHARGKIVEREASGRPLRAIGTHTDVTARRAAADALRESEARFYAVFANASIGMAILAPEGRVLAANAVLCAMLGYGEGELSGMDFRDVTHPDDIEREERLIAELHAHRRARLRLAKRYLRKDGSVLWARLEANLVFDAHGTPQFAIGLVEDLSEQQQTREALEAREAQLRQAQKMEAVGQLAGGIAHDFNNLLTVILGNVGFAREDLDPSHPAQADLREAVFAAERARALVRQLLAFSRRQMVQPRVLDASELVRDVERLLQRVLPETILVATHLPPAPALVRADPAQLEQVVLNLAINARDAMPDGGHLWISVGHLTLDGAAAAMYGVATGRYVTLTVRDTGHGMDAATRARACEPFFTTKPTGKGTGLGLATAYGVVTQAGGVLRVESAPGEGATFEVVLPEVVA